MQDSRLSFYRLLSRFFFPNSYSLKFLGIAFLGIHLPLITFVVYLTVSHGWTESLPAVVVLLLATLLGTGLTLWSQHHLLAPMRLARSDLEAYRTERRAPTCPDVFPDEAGRLMRETRHSIESVDRLLRLKDNLAAGIAHDFRSPLTGIVAAAELLLLDHPTGTPVGNVASVISKSARVQADHVNSLLNAVLRDTSGANFTPDQVKLETVWDQVAATQRLPARQKGIALHFAPTGEIVAGCAARLAQVVNNLVSNAIKACPAGSRIEISTARQSGRIQVCVTDNGPGIDPVKLRHALDQPEEDPIARDGVRLGLGLRMIKSLLHLHGSQLNIRRQDSGGMRFSFALRPAA